MVIFFVTATKADIINLHRSTKSITYKRLKRDWEIGLDETLAALNSKLSTSHVDQHRIIRNYVGGACSSCRGIPRKKVIYDVGDGDKLVEFYCDSCYQKHKSELDKRLQNISFT